MSVTTTTTAELRANIVAQLESELGEQLRYLPKTFTRVLANVLAGVYILLYKYVGFGIQQMFIRTCSASDTEVNGRIVNPLTEWGVQNGTGTPRAATQSQLTIEITVLQQGGSLPAFTPLTSALNGVTYLTNSVVALDSSTVSVDVTASADQAGGNGAGTQGNLDNGEVLSFVTPPLELDRSAIVVGTVLTGADAEDPEVYRQRVLDREQKPPQGGALADYELWGEGVEGILNVYPYRSECPGVVDLFVEATVASSGNADGFPTEAQLQAVFDATQLDEDERATRNPVGAFNIVQSISRTSFDVIISNLSVPDITQTQADIANALAGYYFQRAPFIQGLTAPPRQDRVTQAAITAIIEDVVSSAGGTFDSAAQLVDSAPSVAYSLGLGEKAKLGTVSYV